MAMIEGFIQGIQYESDSNLLYFKARYAGQDASPDAVPTITVYNPSGTEVLAAADTTQYGTSSWYYYDLDASATATFEKGFNYKAQIDFEVSSAPSREYYLLDVVPWPFNEPLWSTEEIETLHPTWTAPRPKGWTDWLTPIYRAHKEVNNELRQMRNHKGDPIYASRILDRDHLREMELAYIERIIIDESNFENETKEYYRDKAYAALQNFTRYYSDDDDDLVIDSDEERHTGCRLIR